MYVKVGQNSFYINGRRSENLLGQVLRNLTDEFIMVLQNRYAGILKILIYRQVSSHGMIKSLFFRDFGLRRATSHNININIACVGP